MDEHNRRWRLYSFAFAACLAVMAGIAGSVLPVHLATPHTRSAIVMDLLPTPVPITSVVTVGDQPAVASARTAFPTSTKQIYCMAYLPNIAPDTLIRVAFQMLPSGQDYFHHDGTADSYNTPLKYASVFGPFEPGRWQCRIFMMSRLMGTAPFTVK